MKKAMNLVIVVLILILTMGVLNGCQSNNDKKPDTDNAAESNTGANDESSADKNTDDTKDTVDSKVITIGIVQPIEHNALDASRKGFIAALADNGYNDGKEIILDEQNGQGDTNNLSTICDRFVSKKVDLVLAIATDSAQAMAAKTTEIPIVATAVTSYTVAGLVDSDEKPGGNVTGTSDMNPVAKQIELITKLVPDAGTIGIIYNNSEDNSILQANLAKEEIERLGLKCAEVTVINTNDVQQAMQSLVAKCDAVYIPTDNTVASAMPTVHGVASEAKIAVICGESNMVQQGGLATMGINYYDLGYKTGLMAVEILKGSDPATMPIQYADVADDIFINGQVAEEIGFVVPDEYKEYVVYPESN